MRNRSVQGAKPQTRINSPLNSFESPFRGFICPLLITSLTPCSFISSWRQFKSIAQCLISPVTAIDHLPLMATELQETRCLRHKFTAPPAQGFGGVESFNQAYNLLSEKGQLVRLPCCCEALLEPRLSSSQGTFGSNWSSPIR